MAVGIVGDAISRGEVPVGEGASEEVREERDGGMHVAQMHGQCDKVIHLLSIFVHHLLPFEPLEQPAFHQLETHPSPFPSPLTLSESRPTQSPQSACTTPSCRAPRPWPAHTPPDTLGCTQPSSTKTCLLDSPGAVGVTKDANRTTQTTATFTPKQQRHSH